MGTFWFETLTLFAGKVLARKFEAGIEAAKRHSAAESKKGKPSRLQPLASYTFDWKKWRYCQPRALN